MQRLVADRKLVLARVLRELATVLKNAKSWEAGGRKGGKKRKEKKSKSFEASTIVPDKKQMPLDDWADHQSGLFI